MNKKHLYQKTSSFLKNTLPEMAKWAIRIVFFLLYPALFSTAFAGVKSITETIMSKTFLKGNPLIYTFLVLSIFTIVFGRFFCGFLCAFGTYGDMIYGISSFVRKKRKKKPLHLFARPAGILRNLKYLVLCTVLISVGYGHGSEVSLHSPFTAFSRLHSLKGTGSTIGLVLFLLISLGMALEPRFFCRFFCPMGAVFSFLPVLPFSTMKRNRENCLHGCQACKRVCPAGIEIAAAAQGDNKMAGECFACGKCRKICPKNNVYMWKDAKKKDWIAPIGKAGILIGALMLLALV